MGISKRSALTLSIVCIIAYWLYQLFSLNSTRQVPALFTDFALQVATTKIIHFTSIALLLWLAQEPWKQLGFTILYWKRQIAYGLLIGLVLTLLFNVGLNSVLANLFTKPINSTGVMNYFTNPNNLLIWLFIGIVGGGFVEELMRIFVLTRFENRFGQVGLYIALTVSSLLFGMGHLYQGTGTAITTSLSGLVMGIIYIRRRKALEVITIHAFSDVLSILAAFYLNDAHK